MCHGVAAERTRGKVQPLHPAERHEHLAFGVDAVVVRDRLAQRRQAERGCVRRPPRRLCCRLDDVRGHVDRGMPADGNEPRPPLGERARRHLPHDRSLRRSAT